MEELYAQNPEEWEAWLKKHYKTESEIWLYYYKKGSGTPSITYEQAVEMAVCYGWIDGVRNAVDDKRYKQRFTPRKPKSIWSTINRNYAEKAIAEGRMTDKGLETIEAAKTSGNWDKTYSLKGEQVIPDDLKEALMKVPVAWENFNKYANSNKFIFLYRLEKVKAPDKRLEKIKRIVELAEQNLKPNGPDRKPLI